MINVPQPWQDVLADIQQVCPSAVIAGGCLRDIYLDKKVKDIDIFIQAGDITEAEGLFEKLDGKPPKTRDFGLSMDEAGAYPDSMTEVILVEDYPGKNPTGSPVQLIFTNWRTSCIIDRFDTGFCQIMFDGKEVRASEWFHHDCGLKVINIRRCESKTHLGSSIKRFARFQKKFPDWELGLDGVHLKE